jgi:NitT/TauT family transport system substrate-binding protein
MVANYFIAQGGLKPTDISVIGVGAGSTVIAAIDQGRVDVVSQTDPAMTILEKDGKIKLIAETRTPEGTEKLFGGPMPAASLYAPVEFIAKNPNTVQALTNAIVRALLWLQKSTTEDVLNAVPPEYLLGDRALYAASFERLRATYSKDGMIPRKGVDNSYKVLLAHNTAVRRAPVVWINQTYTNVFVEKALHQYR